MAGFDINGLLEDLRKSQEDANLAGITRWKNLMGTAGNIRNRALGKGGYFDQMGKNQSLFGQTANRQINDAETQGLADSEQDLTTRGLGNTTVRSAVRRGISTDATNQRTTLQEQIAGEKNNLLSQRAGADMDIGRFMTDLGLSRKDEGPDMGMYLDLIQRLGSSGSLPGAVDGGPGGAGGGGGGGGRSHNFIGGVPSGPTFGQGGGGGGGPSGGANPSVYSVTGGPQSQPSAFGQANAKMLNQQSGGAVSLLKSGLQGPAAGYYMNPATGRMGRYAGGRFV